MRLSSTALLIASALLTSLGFAACSDASSGVTTDEPDASPAADGAPSPSPDATPDVDADAPPVSKVDTTTEPITALGESRTYELAVPKSYDASRAYPLVLVIHGDGGDGPSMHRAHPLDDVSGDDAIVAYPSGKGRLWDLYTAYDTNADQVYVGAIVADVTARFSIDASKVWAVGYSSGAFVISQLACRRALFTGIVLHAGGAPNEPSEAPPKDSFPDCAGVPAATFVVHGTADGTVVLASGQYAASFWAQKSACGTTLTDTAPAPCKAFDGCPAGSRVSYCEVPGLGHVIWPSALQAEWDFLRGP